ncbi:uncharacterized protein I303_104357 [Kwoniella dejecticola CBS 10117]|uniref:Ubiquitin-like domain-containing protein n=1 Tax=Kwoniella dejecticola CBS 10117 TaxID=1296121 RepID=A0A1A6A5J4_9TREE|nr:uncharacterized protein I303_04667 [Kwoniella dejecticola CBS 10117]OBR85332.1 hypothetical protein I303_04667 [Kwoniella dejecticola CBS 10117]
MADKGKGKAVDPIDIGSDSDDDFFVSKKRPAVRQATLPPRSPSPPVRTHSDNEDDGSPDSQQKKRRKPTSKKPALELPSWTRASSNDHKKNGAGGRSRKGSSQARGSTEERGETIVIDDSDEDAGPSDRKPKAIRHRVQLTPPPEMSEAKKAEIEQLVKAHLGSKFQDQETEVVDDSSSSPEKNDGDELEKVFITVRMVAPPEKKLSAAPAAIKEYQKARTLILSRTGHMSKGINTLSDRLQKRPGDLVFVYNDSRVYPRSTPEQLGILHKADMSGYEKEYWDRLQAERRRALEALSDDEMPHDDDAIEHLDSPTSKTNDQLDKMDLSKHETQPTQLTAPYTSNAGDTKNIENSEPRGEEEIQDYIRFIVKSENGKHRMKGQKALRIQTIIKYYCKAIGKPPEEAEKMYLMFDGEKLDKDLTLGETDIEDGDMLDAGMVKPLPTSRRRF